MNDAEGASSGAGASMSTGTSSGSTKSTTPTMHFLLEVNCISPHQVLLEHQIDDFSHKDAGDAIATVTSRFPDSDVSVDSDLGASS
jgi:hypothetical protein